MKKIIVQIVLITLAILNCNATKDGDDKRVIDIKQKVSSQEQSGSSYFVDHELIELDGLPEFPFRAYGYPLSLDIPDTEERMLSYDKASNMVLIVNIYEQIEKLTITVTTPCGLEYSRSMSAAEKGLNIMKSDHRVRNSPSIISLHLYPHAFYDSGIWIIEAYINDDKEQTLRSEVQIDSNSITISSQKEITPYDYASSGTFTEGDSIYIYGYSQQEDSEIKVVLYNVTSRNKDYSPSIMVPTVATSLTTDSKGKFSLELVVGDDLPKGLYKVIYGKEIKPGPLLDDDFYIE